MSRTRILLQLGLPVFMPASIAPFALVEPEGPALGSIKLEPVACIL